MTGEHKLNLLHIDSGQPKQAIVEGIRAHLSAQGFTIVQIEASRPWGAFFRVEDGQADRFVETYFHDVAVPENARRGDRSPKILLVAPQRRLSWQYHDRRAEFWRTVSGTVGVFASLTDAQPEHVQELPLGETVALAQGTRHRLVGLDDWGAIAEIWIHTDPHNPSNEDDIHRLQDDYARI